MNILSYQTIKKLVGFAGPFARYTLFKTKTPVLAGFKITNKCNLKCAHCPYWRRGDHDLTFGRVIEILKKLKSMGVKIIIFEGGEPLLWRNGAFTIDEVLAEAKKLFLSVCITTNGTFPWNDLPLDKVWVSLDGTREIHDSIRGQGIFDRVMLNIVHFGPKKLMISTTINSLNKHDIPEMVRMLKGLVQGITIQFHYPYSGLPDPLFITVEERKAVLTNLIKLKKDGYPVANSETSLRQLMTPKWDCIHELLANAEPDGSIFHGCYLKNRGPRNCELCGFSAHNEMSLAFQGHIDAILTGARIFF